VATPGVLRLFNEPCPWMNCADPNREPGVCEQRTGSYLAKLVVT
jgi:hypothetical protein